MSSSPSATFAAGERLIRRPAHLAEVAVRGRVVDRISLGGSVAYRGRRDDVDFNQFPAQRVELPAYTTVDLAGEVEIVRVGPGRAGVSGTLRAENLFNQAYDQTVGYRGRGRGVFGGVRFQF